VQGLFTLQTVFVSLTAGNLMAMIVEISSLRLGLRLVSRRSSLRRYLAIWKDVRWRSLHNAESRDSVEESGLEGARDAA
jgi:hypothetical protein